LTFQLKLRSTTIALIVFHPCVYQDVTFEGTFLSELLVTKFTFIVFVTRVSIDVICQRTLVTK